MGDPANIGLIDAHAEGHRGTNNQPIILLEPPLYLAPVIRFHPAVIVTCRMTSLGQGARQRFSFGPGAAIDDPRLPFSCCGKIQDLLTRLIFRCKGQMNVRPIKTAQEYLDIPTSKELRNNLISRLCIGGGRQSNQRHIKRRTQLPNPQIVRAEIMAPLADTMRLINGNQTNIRAMQHLADIAGGQALRRHVQQLEPSRL